RPVAERVDERFDCLSRGLRIIGVHRRRTGPDRLVQPGQRPAVDLRPFLYRRADSEVDAVEPGVQHEEAVRIPERIDKGTRNVRNNVYRDTLLDIRRDTRREVPAQGIGADGIEHVVRVDDVADRFRHFLAVLVHDVAQANTVFVRDLIGYEGRYRVQRVEPATGLVDCLADVIRREMLRELLLVLERVMPLRVRHGAGVEPAIDDLRNPPPRLPVLLETDVVHGRTMQVQLVE